MYTVLHLVPAKTITDIVEEQPTVNSQAVTIILPLTPYQPEELLIISIVVYPDGAIVVSIITDYTGPAQQYTVMFTGLDPETVYNYTIRIVLRANNSVDVVPAATGSFMTLMMPSKLNNCLL